ncbi:hypothetical protein Misp01_73550 [Microtetraspora sp. NBRC 13810]|uniref:TIGR02234 family membrane protein n=1 Tax=Microtetraspora sp. NBRC 13810 TaxID=3030990 RepID=UPI0024A37921|nr:TIGR02234 family membrane protein [Microtetraspora sp. NBRC 13810]GLW12227.1 hypothetical protein Misp01_73550 [Microtetraspora sp. NBRC 13810]
MHREQALWILACAVGAGLTLLAAGRDWARVTFTGAGAGHGAAAAVPVTGSELSAALTPLALAAAAAALAVLAARGPWRRLVAAVLALCGSGVAAGALSGTAGQAVADAAREHSALAATGQPVVATLWFWPAAAAAGGLILLAAGVTAAVRAGSWGGMSDRYERPGATGRRADDVPAPALGDRALWDAIDRGADPTADTPERGTGT